MHIHILGICGTFMGGVAALAREAGHHVTGSDANVYPPMSTQLEALGIEVIEGYDPSQLAPEPDCVLIGNALSRGNPCVEHVLDHGLAYTSGPQWLAENILADRWVVAVAGTHGKTTTASMVAWLLQHAGLEPGFLIGGVPRNFEESARLGHHPFFVVEADEYDTAFFDKRSKFVHYRPRTLVLNNLEYDHADIFPDLASIERQFHHLVRIVPASGLILVNGADGNLARVLDMGCWTPVQRFGFTADDDWQAVPSGADGGRFQVFHPRQVPGESGTGMPGRHNISNGVAAIAAAVHCGVPPTMAVEGLSGFAGVRRRMELRGEVSGIRVFDDFAHHPTAISTTLEGARRQAPGRRIVAVLEPRSNTMRAGIHRETLGPSLAGADTVFIFRPPGLQWDLDSMAASHHSASVFDAVEDLVGAVVDQARVGDDIVVMSNGGFGGIHEQLLGRLASDMPNRDSSLSEPAGRRK